MIIHIMRKESIPMSTVKKPIGPRGNTNDPRYNKEGYPDPTAYKAITKADLDLYEARVLDGKERFEKLLHVIKDICKLSGFELEERVVLRDTRTDKIWR
jgi:hypothetical protein